jgi:hypothetical protein
MVQLPRIPPEILPESGNAVAQSPKVADQATGGTGAYLPDH